MGLCGRDDECAAIRGVLDAARTGLSSVLVFRGDAGIGKTSLLDYAVDAAPDFLVVRLVGVETERDFGFAALHRLLLPILHQIERLPPAQRDALNSALGLADGPPANPFLLGLGVLTLATTAARARERLLVVFDDSQWIDRESMTPLVFWARRLHAEGTAVMFAERRETDVLSQLNDFRVIEVGGLDASDSRELLDRSAGPGLNPDVADRIVDEASGNPLALAEFARDLRIDHTVAVGAGLQPLPVSRRVEQRFASRVHSLPVETQMLLLLVAAESSGDPITLWAAAAELGVQPEAAGVAEAEGLLRVGAEVVIPHPLIRSAVYSSARLADRRSVHAALAAATDPTTDPERQAWHLASAAAGPDDNVATRLEDCARRSSERGGAAAAVSLLTRAAELTTDPRRAAEDRLLAAEAALAGGAVAQALDIVAEAVPHLRTAEGIARAQRVEGTAWARSERPGDAAPLLFAAANGLKVTHADLARQTLFEALEQSLMACDAAGDVRVLRTLIAESSLSDPPGRNAVVELALDAFGRYVSSGFVTAAAELRTLGEALADNEFDPFQLMRWTLVGSVAARSRWDRHGEAALMNRIAQIGRARGALRRTGFALRAAASVAISSGEFAAAASLIAEAIEVSDAAGRGPLSDSIVDLELAAHEGREKDARATADTRRRVGHAMGLALVVDEADAAIVTLALGLGQYDEALGLARAIFDRDPIPFGNTILPDLIEAAVRGGDPALARRGTDRLVDRAHAAGSPLAMGLLARSRALVDVDAEPHFVESFGLLESSGSVFELARSQLLYGEWLRRRRRRIDARHPLRSAFELFSTMGAAGFAERARVELLATGERARQRTDDFASDLTPQEANVARLAAGGMTNAEIASQMFLGVSTVEYHLRKVFRKLGITSRRELENAMQSAHRRPTPR